MKKVHTVCGILLAFIIYASCSTLQYSTENANVDKSEAFAWLCGKDSDCNNGAKCGKEVDGIRKCECLTGTTGDTCEKVTDCEAGGKYENCTEDAGKCTFESGKAVCKCSGGKIIDEDRGLCKAWLCGKDSDCNNEAKCGKEVDGIRKCECLTGTTGDTCEKVTECEAGGYYEKCIEDAGKCTFESGTAVCKCSGGKILDEDGGLCKEPCNNNDADCQNEAYCKGIGDRKFCDCKPGTFGDKCGNITDCEYGGKYENCNGENGKCVFENGVTVCKCEDNKKLDEISGFCKEWSCSTDSDCKNEAKCEVGFEDKKICKCKTGTMGETCGILVDCETGGKYENCTGENGTCMFQNWDVVCKCPEEKILDEIAGHCKDQCNPNMCENGGECMVVEGEMKCKCKAPYTGDKCETKSNCENGRYVMDKHRKMKCACNPKHSLTDDETCKPCDCGNKGKCIFQMKVLNGSIQYWKMCVCNKGSAEKDGKCVDCNCGPNSLCEFEGEEKHCYCEEGYTEKDGVCTGVCTDNPCKNGGTCEIRENGYKCICNDHYFGKMCEIGPCADSPCKNGGTCEVVGNDYKCTCKDPYFGKMCEMDSCTPNPCQNGGTCFVDGNMFRCSCVYLVSGTTCETDNRFILAALLLLVVLVFLIIVCGGCCLFKIKQKISQNFQP